MANSPKFSEIVGIDPDELLMLDKEGIDIICDFAPELARKLADELGEVREVHRNRRMN